MPVIKKKNRLNQKTLSPYCRCVLAQPVVAFMLYSEMFLIVKTRS